jgi:effector-binding domain-containing protein
VPNDSSGSLILYCFSPGTALKFFVILHSLLTLKNHKSKPMKKFFKRTAIVLLVLAVVYLVLCLFGPKEMKVVRTATINAKPEAIMPLLTDLKIFQEKWSPFTEKDPNMSTKYEGAAGTVGHKYSWSGNDQVKTGSLTLDSISERKVVSTLMFGESMKSKTWQEVESMGDTSKVSWGMYSETPWFMRGMMVFMNMEKMIGPDFDKGLAKLKTLAEENAAKAAPSFTVNEVDFEARTYIGKKDMVTMEGMQEFFGQNFSAIKESMAKAKVEVTGPPTGLYWNWKDSDPKHEMAAAQPAKAGTKEVKGWEKFEIPAAKAVMIDYYGSYDNLAAGHAAIKKYLTEKNLQESVVLEEYVSDPGSEKDPSKWLTKIYYIVK